MGSQHENILDTKNRSMRNNIMLHGLKETDENLPPKFVKIMAKDYLLTDKPKDIDIDSI